MGGLPRIRNLRIPVATVIAMLADGMSQEEIVAELPDLMIDDIHDALLYAAEAVRDATHLRRDGLGAHTQSHDRLDKSCAAALRPCRTL